MEKIRFNNEHIAQITALVAVEKVTPKMICFTPEFKKSAVFASSKGYTAVQIFTQAGIDVSLFPKKHFQNLLKKWKQKYRKSPDFTAKPKGRAIGWRKRDKQPSQMTKQELEAKLALVEAELDFVKKIHGLKPLY